MNGQEINVEKIFGFVKYPQFELGKPRFPQHTFKGRYLHYLDVIDPRTLFVSKKKIDECLNLLNTYSENKESILASQLSAEQNQQLWKAQKIKQAIFHPDTSEKIFAPFRMSGFVPFGWITVTGMLLPNPTWTSILFWQWVNQSHNACVNYANRNATKQQPNSVYLKAYSVAVLTAIGISSGLTLLIKKADKLSATKKLIIQRFVPLPATSLASSLNVLFMRYSELETGIQVYDENKNIIGTSKIAAKKAVTETALTRAILPIPLLFLPPCIMPFFEKLKFIQKSSKVHLALNAVVCTLSFAFSLPIALALFPQETQISINELEKDIQEKSTKKFLYYNKGL